MHRWRTWRCAAGAKAAGTSSRNSSPGCAPRAGSIDTILRCGSSRRPRKRHAGQRSDQQAYALRLGNRGPRTQHVIALLLNLIEHTEAAAIEQIDIERQ